MQQKKKYRNKRITKKAFVAALACLVALVTVCSVMLPAVAMETKCPLQEHQHGQQCYVQVTDPEQTDLQDVQPGEQAEEEAPDAQQAKWQLICLFPEHLHTEACTKQPETEAVKSEPQPEQLPETGTPQIQAYRGEEPQAEPPQKNGPIDIIPYVQHAKLTYKDKDNAPGSIGQEIVDGTTVPGDARLHLDVEYDQVPVGDLIENGGELHFTVPDIMRNPVSQGDIHAGQQIVGTIQANGNQMLLRFETAWLQSLLDSQQNSLHGEFYVESDVNLSVIPGGGGSVDIVIGQVEIKPNFEPDAIARYGKLEIEKVVSNHVIENNQVHGLEYQLKVKAGEDGSPAVKVVDQFTLNKEYVEYDNITAQPKALTDSGSPREQILEGKRHGQIYKAPFPTAENPIPSENSDAIVEPGCLVWNIGDMAPNEERTLIYYVRLQDHPSAAAHEDPLRNEAKVFSKIYKRDDVAVDFTPKADLDIQKSHAKPVRNEDGSYTITYTVRFTAGSANNHDLRNVQVIDSLNHPDHATNAKALQYITYDKSSFQLFHTADATGPAVLVNGAQGPKPTLVYGQDDKSFTLAVGNMDAGESYSFRYSVRVGVEAFAAGHLESLNVKNRVMAKADNAESAAGPYLDKHDDTSTIAYKNWIQKAAGAALAAPATLPLGEHVYDATGNEIVEQPDHPGEFTVPAGSYPYSVSINHLGDFDVTAAQIGDTLKSKYLHYTGYLRIDAFDTKQTGEDPLGVLAETRYMKIDGGTAFQFRLTDLGFRPNSYAYRLSYYAAPVDVGDVITAVAKNVANIQGQVGTKDHTIIIDEFDSEASVTVAGDQRFEVDKEPWYYEKATVTSGSWANGAIYWGVKIDGTKLHAGTIIKDHVKIEGAHHERGEMYFHNGSLVGLYRGSLPQGKVFNDYADLQSFVNSGNMTQIPESAYGVEYKNVLNYKGTDNFSDVLVEMRETVEIGEGNSIFLIVKGEPMQLPNGARTKKDYTNYVATKTGGTDFLQRDLATKHLYGGQNILKEFGSYLSFDGRQIRYIKNGKAGNVPNGLLSAPGHYIVWNVKLNYGGDLAGAYRVVDELPEGVELDFARLKWVGGGNQPQQIQMRKIEDLGPEWTEHVIEAGMDGNQGTVQSYYYTNGRKVMWEVDTLVAGHELDKHAVDFQVVARVADPDVLQGGADRTFLNSVSLLTTDGQKLDSAANSVEVSAGSIQKSSLKDENQIHYTIELNPLGEDLLPGADVVTLVDEMSDTLRLDLTTIEVVNSRDNTPVRFQASMGEKELFLTLPDNTPITVRYMARIYAVPGSVVTLSNQAYWMGYDASTGDGDRYDNVEYEIGGTAGSGTFPHVQVLKFDKNDITHFLEGAVFLMEEGDMVDGTFVPTPGKTWRGTTGSDGTLTFGNGTDADPHLDFNVVYRITEQKAPAGYQVDGTHYHFLFAKKVDGQYPQYPKNIHVHYDARPYVLRVGNRRMEAYVEKQFEKADGTPVPPIYGTYRFGLYDNPQGSGDPLQIAELVFNETSAENRAAFQNLAENKTYYVFELDDAGSPILPGQFGNVGRIPFQVVYSSQLPADTNAVSHGHAVTVTNRMTVESMPETGGTGTAPYRLAGLVLVVSALTGGGICLKKERSRRK